MPGTKPTRTLTRLGASVAIAAAITAGAPALAGAQPVAPSPAPESSVPYCKALPMIMIYPPPPTRIQCHTGFGDFVFTLPPGTHWPF
ncbi:hypothetical protein [Rhodococcus sp. NPDC058521]|uniref:hypothetical protein n=1 Tax=Rhodococcus sp. NPDC058521 TaxID=3346536 RepID=UPI0036500D4F